MSGKVWRIPNPQWRQLSEWDCVADTMLGKLSTMKTSGGRFYWSFGNEWGTVGTLDEAKAKCEALYRERMERGLEEVKDGN